MAGALSGKRFLKRVHASPVIVCVTSSSVFFWIGLALLLGVGFACFRAGQRLWRDASAARDPESWTAVFMDRAPALVVSGLWLMILVFAGASCGIGL